MRFVPVYAMGIILISGLLVAAQGQPKAGLTCMQRVFGLAKDCPSEPIDGSEPNDPRVMRCCAAVEMINDNECFCNPGIVNLLGEYYTSVAHYIPYGCGFFIVGGPECEPMIPADWPMVPGEDGLTAPDNNGDMSIQIEAFSRDAELIETNVEDDDGEDDTEMDITPPTIRVNGKRIMKANEYSVGENYVEKGATAFDLRPDGTEIDLTSRIRVRVTERRTGQVRQAVDTRRAGVYEVRYQVEDEAGNAASATRYVRIVPSRGQEPSLPTMEDALNDFLGTEEDSSIESGSGLGNGNGGEVYNPFIDQVQCYTFGGPLPDGPAAIPTEGGGTPQNAQWLVSKLFVRKKFQVTFASVSLNVTHPEVSDLRIKLRAGSRANAKTVTLFARKDVVPGAANLLNTTFTDFGSNLNIDSDEFSAQAPFSGNYQPVQPFKKFLSEAADASRGGGGGEETPSRTAGFGGSRGMWKLMIGSPNKRDSSTEQSSDIRQTGTLDGWSLTLCGKAYD